MMSLLSCCHRRAKTIVPQAFWQWHQKINDVICCHSRQKRGQEASIWNPALWNLSLNVGLPWYDKDQMGLNRRFCLSVPAWIMQASAFQPNWSIPPSIGFSSVISWFGRLITCRIGRASGFTTGGDGIITVTAAMMHMMAAKGTKTLLIWVQFISYSSYLISLWLVRFALFPAQ